MTEEILLPKGKISIMCTHEFLYNYIYIKVHTISETLIIIVPTKEKDGYVFKLQQI